VKNHPTYPLLTYKQAKMILQIPGKNNIILLLFLLWVLASLILRTMLAFGLIGGEFRAWEIALNLDRFNFCSRFINIFLDLTAIAVITRKMRSGKKLLSAILVGKALLITGSYLLLLLRVDNGLAESATAALLYFLHIPPDQIQEITTASVFPWVFEKIFGNLVWYLSVGIMLMFSKNWFPEIGTARAGG
jgi:hypothetical protein